MLFFFKLLDINEEEKECEILHQTLDVLNSSDDEVNNAYIMMRRGNILERQQYASLLGMYFAVILLKKVHS